MANSKPCFHQNYTDACHVCWLGANVREFQRRWGLPVTGTLETAPADRLRRSNSSPQPKPRPRPVTLPPCSRLGLPTGETLPCPTCTGTVRVPLLTCSLHGECSETKLVKRDGVPVKCCAACKDRTVEPFVPAKRHLAYHLLPVRGDVWKRNLDELARRWELFDGVRVISVVRGGPVVGQGGGPPLELEDQSDVRKYLPAGADVVETDNDPGLWELASWPALFGRVSDASGPSDVVFYAHAKGVSRPQTPAAIRWARVMYASLLDRWALVESELRSRPLAGSFKKVGRFFRTHHPDMVKSVWHYSGTFFWGRVYEVIRRMTAVPPSPHPWGAESWVGQAFAPHEGAEVFGLGGKGNLYNPRDVARAERAYADRNRT